jgi:hypothetical protein
MDPVTGIGLHDPVPEPLDIALDHTADHVDLPPRPNRLDRAIERLSGALGQQP